jgi:hypothetical protein
VTAAMQQNLEPLDDPKKAKIEATLELLRSRFDDIRPPHVLRRLFRMLPPAGGELCSRLSSLSRDIAIALLRFVAPERSIYTALNVTMA